MIARRAITSLAIVAQALLVTACGGSSSTPTAPTPPPVVGTPGPQRPDPPSPDGPPESPTPPGPVPRLGRTRIVAFGDSMTEGVVSAAAFRLVTDPMAAYPRRLTIALGARYSEQTIEVVNEGRAGEWAVDAIERFHDMIRDRSPEVILLMEGANDLNFLGRKGVSPTIGALESMVKYARGRGVPILLANLPPQRPDSRSGLAAAFVDEFNRQVRTTAVDEGAIFVDVAGGFGSGDGLIGPDGLHPTPEGYEKLAQIFMDVIRANFEQAPVQPPSAR